MTEFGFVKIRARKNRRRMATMGIFTTEYRQVARMVRDNHIDAAINSRQRLYETLSHKLMPPVMDEKSLRAKRLLEKVATMDVLVKTPWV